tara:strand:+ start:18033 stop:18263 length:231 start_codon:yes stop_codon:yes gene_type:complete
MLGKYINFPVFLVSLAIGILFVYLFQSELNVIYVYPTPDNQNKILYKDKTDNCFKFNAEEVECPDDKTKIKNIPIQ